MRHRTLAALAALAAAPLTAHADPPRGRVSIPTIEIRGRVPKPLAAVVVTRVAPSTGARGAAAPSLVDKVAAAVDDPAF
ncbi:MAG: hypothetical protein IT374_26035 [Polyangiaceae bacterium]|nr:hypothetical protein [Polyangiaceae bacterium]